MPQVHVNSDFYTECLHVKNAPLRMLGLARTITEYM